MREIRFRAWLIKENTYIYFDNTYQWHLLYSKTGDWNVYPIFNGKPGNCLEEGKDFLLEQYTGFKDSEGKEIYEGDIVEAFMNEDDIQKSEVEWWRGTLVIDFKSSESDIEAVGWFLDKLGNIKIIGNIHERGEV